MALRPISDYLTGLDWAKENPISATSPEGNSTSALTPWISPRDTSKVSQESETGPNVAPTSDSVNRPLAAATTRYSDNSTIRPVSANVLYRSRLQTTTTMSCVMFLARFKAKSTESAGIIISLLMGSYHLMFPLRPIIL